eukprot:CAMPEP_0182864582 /NCGR_PEP_ID=MMETSP0034_2-20130328/7241_1 /TAXON_ID=156128 /ORGANISM="Nephroselmis pyriformis, Strain CCMP717" /LENGTH=89 /DNA_ID=CAMNT_0024996841 /DNA_START=630 /DNA_END=899 /DNA_ORIENTATION=-
MTVVLEINSDDIELAVPEIYGQVEHQRQRGPALLHKTRSSKKRNHILLLYRALAALVELTGGTRLVHPAILRKNLRLMKEEAGKWVPSR